MRMAIMFALGVSLLAAESGRTRAHEQDQKTAQSETRSRSGAQIQSLTGIIDEQGSRWVISTEDSVRPMAVLRGAGFKDTNFARYVGTKVRLQGRMIREGGDDIFIVSKLSDIVEVNPTARKDR